MAVDAQRRRHGRGLQVVTVSADLARTVERINFDSGRSVRAAEVSSSQTRQERAQLTALEAQRNMARLTFVRMQGLLSERVISKAEFDQATSEQKQTEARVGEVKATMERKTIRAPFSEILGIRQVNLASTGRVTRSWSSRRSARLTSASTCHSTRQDKFASGVRHDQRRGISGASPTGRVTALDSVVNQETRNVRIQAMLQNWDGHTPARHVCRG